MAGMEHFTQRGRRVLALAHQEASRLRQSQICTEHLLMGLMLEEDGVAGRVLRDLGATTDRMREVIEMQGGYGTQNEAYIDLSTGTKHVLEFAIDEANRMNNHYISTEHLLLGIVRSTEDKAGEVLRKLGITPEQIRRQTRRVLEEGAGLQAAATAPGEPYPQRGEERKKDKTPLVDQLVLI